MDPDPKRQRTDAGAAIPSDTAATTPMGKAKATLKASVASLRPELATILTRLGNEYLLCLHRENSKTVQVTKLETTEYIPISARVKFSLRNSKLVDGEEDYKALQAETTVLVENFQKNLKAKILAATKMEVTKMKAVTLDTFATNIRMCVESCLLCESTIHTVNVDKFIHTLLFLYEKIYDHIGSTKAEFENAYKRIHTLAELPVPYVTELPTDNNNSNRQTTITLPPTWILDQLPKIGRLISQIFIDPFQNYLDIEKRNQTSLSLKTLSNKFFYPEKNDKVDMEVDEEEAVEAKVMNDLIASKVAASTKKLSVEINKLRKQLDKQLKITRDSTAGAAKKKKAVTAGGNANDTSAGKGSKKKPPKSILKPPRSSTTRRGDSPGGRGSKKTRFKSG